MARLREVIRLIEPADSVERYTKLGVDVRVGYARIVDPWTVEIGGERLTARSIVIAAGAEPLVPPIPGIEQSGYLTSDTMWDALAERETPPRRLVILGGGPIGIEMAQAFRRLGSNVTVVQGGAHLLAKEDEEVSEFIAAQLRPKVSRYLPDARRCGARANRS
jgi:pyruvate/2-oxoglutarate dehydrogenase complex dihydrolipoamide dehydrogenase (E3) component